MRRGLSYLACALLFGQSSGCSGFCGASRDASHQRGVVEHSEHAATSSAADDEKASSVQDAAPSVERKNIKKAADDKVGDFGLPEE
jgi:hypothetical protein